MERKIGWQSGYLDDIEFVYQKAESAGLAAQLEQLETQALAEAREGACLLKTRSGERTTPEQFDALPESERENVIYLLGGGGIASMKPDFKTSTINVTLAPVFPLVQACTVFFLLNSLDKLDGGLVARSEKWTLALQVPLGGKKGLFQWEMLMMQLYPWISVSESASNMVAITDRADIPAMTDAAGTPGPAMTKTAAAPAPQGGGRKAAAARKPAEEKPVAKKPVEETPAAATGQKPAETAEKKKPFWKKLFGK